jgi:hypothetical protein
MVELTRAGTDILNSILDDEVSWDHAQIGLVTSFPEERGSGCLSLFRIPLVGLGGSEESSSIKGFSGAD